MFGVMHTLLKNCFATDHLSKLCQEMGEECNVLYTKREIKGTGSSIGGTQLTPFLRRNLISVRRNTIENNRNVVVVVVVVMVEGKQ